MRINDIIREAREAPLFHGTDLVSAISILKENTLHGSKQYENNPMGVSLSRDYLLAREAGTWWEREYPVVFVLDQAALVRSPLKMFPRRDSDDRGEYRQREAEEMVLDRIPQLDRYLVSVNCDLRHLAAAANNVAYIEYLVDEEQYLADNGGPPVRDFLKSPEAFREAILWFGRHPKLNKWLPRVQYRKGAEQIPTD